MTPDGMNIRVGVEVGWVGYPGVSPARDRLCFFSGRISAWLEDKHAYLVDGVAISGVSGGPAFFVGSKGQPVLLGVMSAYLPNKTTGAPLPGLSLVQHIGQLEKVVKDLGELGEQPRARRPRSPPPRRRRTRRRSLRSRSFAALRTAGGGRRGRGRCGRGPRPSTRGRPDRRSLDRDGAPGERRLVGGELLRRVPLVAARRAASSARGGKG